MDHDRNAERGSGLLGAPHGFDVVTAGDILGNPHFDADDDIAVTCRVIPTFAPVATVTVTWRVMFAPPQQAPTSQGAGVSLQLVRSPA